MTNMLTKYEINANEAAGRFNDVSYMKVHHPALFSHEAHPKMSERYSFTHTYDIVRALQDKRYCVSSISGGETRYSKMLIRMRHENYMYADHTKADGAPELIIMDSHDGSKALRLALGYIKFLCMNGQIAGDMLYARMFRHAARDLMQQVMLEVMDINKYVDSLTSNIDDMRNYRTTIADRIRLADVVTTLRWGDKKDDSFKVEMRPRLLHRRRREDTAEDLHTVVNVIQENAIRGGFSYNASSNTHDTRFLKSKPVNNIDTNYKINTALWNEASSLMKQAA